MICVAVDIDDTLINTDRRMQAIWRELLGCDVSLEDVETLGLEQIFMKYASPEQKTRANDFQRRFWDIVLCLDTIGVESLWLHAPVPFAADVLQKWSKQCTIVYLTGRTENTRSITLHEFEKFGFPTTNTKLVMFNLEDYARMRGKNATGSTFIDAKARLLTSISTTQNVARVIDDYPGYFPVYSKFKIPDRIGFRRAKRYTSQQYIEKGATRVIENWKELLNDML